MRPFRNSHLVWILVLGLLSACSDEGDYRSQKLEEAAFIWGGMALNCTAIDTEMHTPRPTITARALALSHTAMFDAWTRYDDRARPLYLSGVARAPKGPEFEREKAISISYAAARTLYTYYPDCRNEIMRLMDEMGLEFQNYTLDPETPEGIGNLAARAVIESHRNDLSNQFASPPYHDFTGYVPVNRLDSITDPARWQPKLFTARTGSTYALDCLTPHWHWVTPLTLAKADQFRPPAPPALDSDELLEELREVIDLQANLTNEDKALVEFMRDGPSSVQQAGHWLIFARAVARRDRMNNDQVVKLSFVVAAAAHDAFIACWDAKMHYDFARPQALIHHYFGADSLTGWMGEGKGWDLIAGRDWRPYSPSDFLCPPFPSYPSGHSCVSGACSEALRLFTGSDDFNYSVKIIPGAMTEPDRAGPQVTLDFPTFSYTAEAAGRSRVLGGYHIETENQVGLKLGRNVAEVVFDRYIRLIQGQP